MSMLLKSMANRGTHVSRRTFAIAQQMMPFSSTPSEPPVMFESKLAMRTYILNRPSKLNALNEPMLSLLRSKIEEWASSDLCTIVATGVGRAFCAGGDVASVAENASNPATRAQAIDFFKREFEMDYILATLKKPYIAILDGTTMGGGVGLAAHAPFRIATENTNFAMPETKIGYCPDVGGSYFLSRMDGQLGTYFSLTGNNIKGRHVFEVGFATHYIPSRRIPILLDRLSTLEAENPSQASFYKTVNAAIEEFTAERLPEEASYVLTKEIREALDYCFQFDDVEMIVKELDACSSHSSSTISSWAKETLNTLYQRSPTSLKVALKAIRLGKHMSLHQVLDMELKIATAFCNGASPDFITGVTALLIQKATGRPAWSPPSLPEISDELVSRFFAPDSPYLASAPSLSIPKQDERQTMVFALPTEDEIGAMVRGSHSAGGGTGLSLEELVSKFENIYSGKQGVKEKVFEVAQRKCEIRDNGGDGNFVWLYWKHGVNHP